MWESPTFLGGQITLSFSHCAQPARYLGCPGSWARRASGPNHESYTLRASNMGRVMVAPCRTEVSRVSGSSQHETWVKRYSAGEAGWSTWPFTLEPLKSVIGIAHGRIRGYHVTRTAASLPSLDARFLFASSPFETGPGETRPAGHFRPDRSLPAHCRPRRCHSYGHLLLMLQSPFAHSLATSSPVQRPPVGVDGQTPFVHDP